MKGAPVGSTAVGVPWPASEIAPAGWWLASLHVLALLFGLATGSLLVASMRKPTRGSLTSCKSNLKNIATALEMYASDFGGRYPPGLEQLTVGNYLKLVPTCPSAGKMTYTDSYQVAQYPEGFRFVGRYHEIPSQAKPAMMQKFDLIGHP